MNPWITLALQLAAASVASIVAFAVLLPTKWGEKALTFHFDKKLSDLKETQNQRIEELKDRLNHLSDRGKHSNEREFKALSEVWERYVDAFYATQRCVVSGFFSEDIANLDQEELYNYLDFYNFSNTQKKAVLNATDRNSRFTKLYQRRLVADAGNNIFDARLLLRRIGIFIPDDLVKTLNSSLDLMSGAQTEKMLENDFGRDTDVGRPETMRFLNEKDANFEFLLAKTRQRLLRDLSED